MDDEGRMLFSTVCELFEELEDLDKWREPTNPRLSKRQKQEKDVAARRREHNAKYVCVERWYEKHRRTIDRMDVGQAEALLSTLLPQERPDRVYWVGHSTVSKIFANSIFSRGRSSIKGEVQRNGLASFKLPHGTPLEERIYQLKQANPRAALSRGPSVTIEEIDLALAWLGSAKRTATEYYPRIGQLFERLAARESKWFTRLLLKDLGRAELNGRKVAQCTNHFLCSALKVKNRFSAAVAAVKELGLWTTSPQETPHWREKLLTLRLQYGVPSKLPKMLKGRSSNEICKDAAGLEGASARFVAFERKIDGYFAEIHVDRQRNDVRIFSKSRKDKTEETQPIPNLILRKLSQDIDQCILAGEIVVWDRRQRRVLPFWKICSHLKWAPVQQIEPKGPHEQLMIFLFDVIQVNSETLIHKTYRERQQRLQCIISQREGEVAFPTKQEVCLSFGRMAQSQVLEICHQAFSKKWEGLVMKPMDDPYLNFDPFELGSFRSCWTKMKQDYIAGFGDTITLAIIGSRFDPGEAEDLRAQYHLSQYGPGYSKTRSRFFLACFLKKGHDLEGYGSMLLVVGSVNLFAGKELVQRLCRPGAQVEESVAGRDSVPYSVIKPHGMREEIHFYYRTPIPVEVKGVGFDSLAGLHDPWEPPDTGDKVERLRVHDQSERRFAQEQMGPEFQTVRHPQILEERKDLTWLHCITFEELQDIAKKATDEDEYVDNFATPAISTQASSSSYLTSGDPTTEADPSKYGLLAELEEYLAGSQRSSLNRESLANLSPTTPEALGTGISGEEAKHYVVSLSDSEEHAQPERTGKVDIRPAAAGHSSLSGVDRRGIKGRGIATTPSERGALVRMDTSEMRPTEIRCDDGTVVTTSAIAETPDERKAISLVHQPDSPSPRLLRVVENPPPQSACRWGPSYGQSRSSNGKRTEPTKRRRSNSVTPRDRRTAAEVAGLEDTPPSSPLASGLSATSFPVGNENPPPLHVRSREDIRARHLTRSIFKNATVLIGPILDADVLQGDLKDDLGVSAVLSSELRDPRRQIPGKSHLVILADHLIGNVNSWVGRELLLLLLERHTRAELWHWYVVYESDGTFDEKTRDRTSKYFMGYIKRGRLDDRTEVVAPLDEHD